ncbi:p60 domain-containing protein [Aureobasidium pullulans]|nr:p60 domain-containing protein [Aureobasidium pullulans]
MAPVAEKTQAAPATHKQPSRKGKKAWRKNVDITELQEGVEDVRDQIIQGGVLTERPADELFVTDIKGSDSVQADFNKRHKSLKADEIIAQRSKVPAVDSRKRKADGIATGSSKRNKNGTFVSHKDLQHLRSVANSGGAQTDIIKATESADHDPWGMEPLPQDPRFSFIPEKKAKVAPKTLKYAPISLAANGKPFAAVPKPSAGKSYNPTFEDWDAHVTKVGEREVAAERKRLQEAQEEHDRLEKALAEAARPEPSTDDEYQSAYESEWEGIQSEAEDSGAVTKKRPERKTPSQRNKIKRRKELEHKAKWDKQMKKKEEQLERVKEIALQLAEKERLLAEQKALQPTGAGAEANVDAEINDEDENEVLRRRNLGKHAVPDAPLEVVLADELQDSLRALRPEGNLLKDRYRNMLLNGKLETRRTMQHKKPKREVTEKWSYKDWKLR